MTQLWRFLAVGMLLLLPAGLRAQTPEIALLSRYVQQGQVAGACGIRSKAWGEALELAATERLMARRGSMAEGDMQTLIENARESGVGLVRRPDGPPCAALRADPTFLRGADLLVAFGLKIAAQCLCATHPGGCNEPSFEQLRAPPASTPIPRVPRQPTTRNVDCSPSPG